MRPLLAILILLVTSVSCANSQDAPQEPLDPTPTTEATAAVPTPAGTASSDLPGGDEETPTPDTEASSGDELALGFSACDLITLDEVQAVIDADPGEPFDDVVAPNYWCFWTGGTLEISLLVTAFSNEIELASEWSFVTDTAADTGAKSTPVGDGAFTNHLLGDVVGRSGSYVVSLSLFEIGGDPLGADQRLDRALSLLAFVLPRLPSDLPVAVQEFGANSPQYLCYRNPCVPDDDPSLPRVEVVAEKALRHSQFVDQAGGTITAAGANGTEYRLTFPKDAVGELQEIVITPISGLADSPVGDLFVGGVRLEPEGLLLLKPVVLEIVPPALEASTETLALGSASDGTRPFAVPHDESATGFRVELVHFSNYSFVSHPPNGASLGAFEAFRSAVFDWQVETYGSPVDALSHAMAGALVDGAVDQSAYIAALGGWLPQLERAVALAEDIVSAPECGGQLEVAPALVAYARWMGFLQSDSAASDRFSAEADSYRSRMAEVMSRAYLCERERCLKESQQQGDEDGCTCANMWLVIKGQVVLALFFDRQPPDGFDLVEDCDCVSAPNGRSTSVSLATTATRASACFSGGRGPEPVLAWYRGDLDGIRRATSRATARIRLSDSS